MKQLLILFMFVLSVPLAQADINKDIVVSHAWVRLMPPSEKMTAAYMTIENKTDKEIILDSASSDEVANVEIHKMVHTNGMMTMGMAGNLVIPAKGKVVLEPGGFHLMLTGLKKSMAKNEDVTIKLHFHDGSSIIVKAPALMDADDHMNMPMMKM